MAASPVQNPAVQSESKSAKKKKVKAIERTESPAPTASPAPEKADGSDESGDSAYIRELQKNIRNTNKKLTNASKIDNLIVENAGKTLDELVAARIINADQKAQYLKKPALQAQVSQYEEQLAQYKKVDQEYRTRAATEKAELEKEFAERLEKEKAEAVAEVKAKLEGDSSQSLSSKLLTLSQFLRLAAARRSEDADQTVDENLALEGVLLSIYTGDESAVAAMVKLVDGTDDLTYSVNGDQLQTTFAQVKAASQAYKSPYEETAAVEAEAAATEPVTDPTVANATVNEIEAGEDVAITNGHTEEVKTESPTNANITSGSANAAGEKWDQTNDNSMSLSQEWVSVPRDPAETETGVEATPAAAANTQSWADDQPEHHETQPEAPAPAAADPNDGFHQVQGRNRGRGDREGGSGYRGRGRGEWRGRGGHRGEGRGRGRGGQRGGSVSMRGPRRTEES